jgi:hypothetical protein
VYRLAVLAWVLSGEQPCSGTDAQSAQHRSGSDLCAGCDRVPAQLRRAYAIEQPANLFASLTARNSCYSDCAMIFTGDAYVSPASAEDNPDAYLCIDSEETKGIVIRVGSKAWIEDLEEMAASLNAWRNA